MKRFGRRGISLRLFLETSLRQCWVAQENQDVNK
jgi:hypothetical protein